MKTKNSLTWRTLAAAGILAGVLSVTACGGNSETAPATVPASETASAPASATGTGTETTPASTNPTWAPKPDGPVAADGKTPLTGSHGLKVKGVAENENGQYLQITLSDNDPALIYDENIILPSIAKKFTPEEIKDAQKFAMTFFVEEGIDSTVNNGSNVDEWYQREKSNFTARVQPEVLGALNSGQEFIHRRAWGATDQYSFAYDKDSTRIVSYEIVPTGVVTSENPENSESMLFVFDYKFVSAQKNLAGKVHASLVDGLGKVGVEKDPANPGKWVISQVFIKYDIERGVDSVNPQ